MYQCHVSSLSVTICPIKMALFKMRCFMPESYNVLKICLEVIVAITQFNYVYTSTNAQVYYKLPDKVVEKYQFLSKDSFKRLIQTL